MVKSVTADIIVDIFGETRCYHAGLALTLLLQVVREPVCGWYNERVISIVSFKKREQFGR